MSFHPTKHQINNPAMLLALISVLVLAATSCNSVDVTRVPVSTTAVSIPIASPTVITTVSPPSAPPPVSAANTAFGLWTPTPLPATPTPPPVIPTVQVDPPRAGQGGILVIKVIT